MGKSKDGKVPGFCRPPVELLRQARPLEFVHEIHMCERRLCDFLEKFSETGTSTSSEVTEAVHFLNHDLPLYLLDEEADIFPLLQNRCGPDEEIDTVIARLLNDHGHAQTDAKAVANILEHQIAKPGPPNRTAQKVLCDFATHSRRHLTMENAIIFPLARLHLTQNDLSDLAARMLDRRGIPSSENSNVTNST